MKIAQVLPGSNWGDIGPEVIEKGLGGRETAMIHLSRHWARLGHEVTNFVPCERGRRFDEDQGVGGRGHHEYIPIGLTNPLLANFPWDACIAWEIPSVFKNERIRENVRVKICEMQVAHFTPGEMEHAEAWCDYIAALSPWHGQFLLHSGLNFDPERVYVLPNGINVARYHWRGTINPEKPWSFVYSSSPDRGLWNLLKSWKYIRRDDPQAKLRVCYGNTDYLDTMKWSHGRKGEEALEISMMINQPGVEFLGRIGQKDLAFLQEEATAWLYPLDAYWPTETGCITAIENAAAGNPLIISDGDCLEDEFGHFSRVIPLPFDAKEWAEATIETLSDVDSITEMGKAGYEFAATRDWSLIAPQWLELIENHS